MIKLNIIKNIISNLKNYFQIMNENIYVKLIYFKLKLSNNINYKSKNYKCKKKLVQIKIFK